MCVDIVTRSCRHAHTQIHTHTNTTCSLKGVNLFASLHTQHCSFPLRQSTTDHYTQAPFLTGEPAVEAPPCNLRGGTQCHTGPVRSPSPASPPPSANQPLAPPSRPAVSLLGVSCHAATSGTLSALPCWMLSAGADCTAVLVCEDGLSQRRMPAGRGQ